MKNKLITSLLLLSISLAILAKGRRVLFIGDSITDGAWGNSKVWNTPSEQRNQKDLNHIYGHGYMMIAASQIQALHPEEEWTFWNRGISGNTLDDLAARWDKDAIALHPDVVSILIGTNDADKVIKNKTDFNIEAWGKQYRNLLNKTKKQNNSVHFILCTPFVAKAGKLAQASDYNKRDSIILCMTKEIEKIAAEYDAVVVPFNTLVEKTIKEHPTLPASYWIWDGIHPTPAMHYLMAEKWIKCSQLIK